MRGPTHAAEYACGYSALRWLTPAAAAADDFSPAYDAMATALLSMIVILRLPKITAGREQ